MPYLLLELNVDGEREAALSRVAAATETWLAPIFSHAVADLPMGDLFRRYALDLRTYPWGAIGLNFNGTPERLGRRDQGTDGPGRLRHATP